MYYYRKNAYRKYLCLAFGIFLGVILAIPINVFLPYLTVAVYDKTGLRDAAKGEFPEQMSFLSDNTIITDELFIPAMGYNSMEPYFFSKFYARQDPGRYDVPLWKAMVASGSVPAGFDPESWFNFYDQEDELIDGGVICNSPSLYAYFHSKHMLGHSKIRILSIGTAVTKTRQELIAEKTHDDPNVKMSQLNA